MAGRKIVSLPPDLEKAVDDFRFENRRIRSPPPVDRDGAGGGKGRPGHSDLTDASHRFRVGERVIFHSAATLPQFSGAYVVERLLPDSGAGLTYHIKRAKDGHTRAASERELTPDTPF
jgi:hypothetical protein